MLPDPAGSAEPLPTPPHPPGRPHVPGVGRALVVLEVLICSDLPTQFLLGTLFASLGFPAVGPGNTLNAGPVIVLSLVDSVLLVGLIVIFLRAHGERPSDVLFGARPKGAEAMHGVPLIFAAIVIAVAVLGTIQWLAPELHPPINPMGELIQSPADALLFALVVIVAGGIREEIQRAFLLHRFEHWLGGGMVGVVVTSVMFGAGHQLQGTDAMIATGLLGAFWGVTYLRRRSVVAPIVSHAGFDLLQIVVILSAP